MAHYPDNLDDKYFRLATVGQANHPDTGEAVPSITLATHELLDAVEIGYNALSYTWGAPRIIMTDEEKDAKRSILMNEQIVDVQPNLYDALHELQTACEGIPIWIDALCINQSDDSERSAQVSVMNQIYGKAKRVIVWLGKPYPELEAGIKAAERLGTESVPHILRMLGTQTWDFTYDMSLMPKFYGMGPLNEEEVIGLFHLLSCRWFARVWVIQEVSLAEDIVVMCNQKFTPFDCVGLTATFLHYSGLELALMYSVTREHPAYPLMLSMNIYQSERLQLLREWCKGEASMWSDVLSTIDFGAGLAQEHQKSSSMLMLRLLFSTFGFEATDPRDIVYGMGGILKHMASEQGLPVASAFEPNYATKAKDLFTDVSRNIIETTDSLVCLTILKDFSARQTPGLPSWAMDYSTVMCNSVHGPQFRSVGVFDASRYTPKITTKRHFTIEEDTLTAFGFPLGIVQKTAEDFEESFLGRLDRLADLLLTMEPVYPHTNQPADEALLRTLIWDSDLTNRPAQNVKHERFRKMMLEQITMGLKRKYAAEAEKSAVEDLALSSIQTMGYLDKVAAKYPSSFFPSVNLVKSTCAQMGLIKPQQEGGPVTEEIKTPETPSSEKVIPPRIVLGSMWYARRPFLTDTGYLGAGYMSIEAGDELWIVSGSPAPLILRRTGARDDEFTIVGEAYVHGIMHGETVTGDVVWKKIYMI
ncbi:Ff.00g087060.m01.CDS01 [Fusarium sp. VM40]|nr:Ff.00g087060.m01.CDS01 [Fusarium sp. VM40]